MSLDPNKWIKTLPQFNKESDIPESKLDNEKWENIQHIVISYINEYYSEGNEFIINKSENQNNANDYGDIESAFIADITDVDSKLWDSFDINVVPTMAVFKNGKLEKRWNGILGQGLNINQIEEANSFFSNL